VGVATSTTAAAHSTDSERNKAVVRQLPGLLRTVDTSAIKALFTEDFQLHDRKHPDWPRGHDGAVRLFLLMTSMMPDMTISIEDMIGEADKVCVRWRFRGTLTGAFEEQKGDGSRYEATAFAIYRFATAALPRIGVRPPSFRKATLG